MFHRIAILSIAITCLACLAACSMAPRYSRPEAPVSSTWPAGPAYKEVMGQPDGKAVADTPWQEFFVNPQLQKLIDLALANNRDLHVATLNIERSRAQYRIQRSDLFPKVDADTSANYKDLSGTGHSVNLHQYTIGLGVSSYELDLFGRVKNLSEQALQQFFASGEARRSVQISLVAEVAANYLRLAADRELLKLAKDTLMSQQASYQLIHRRYESGVSSALDLHQAQISVDTARVDVSRFTTFVAQDENGLNLVVGSRVEADLLPGALSETLTAVKDLQPGLPSDVLLSRPDILEAEALLKAANANIGAARAA